MLASKVIPAQRRMIDSLAELLEIHIAEADSHGARTDTQLKNAGTIVILMVPVALALALLIGFTAWRRLSTLLSTLHASNAALRSTLNDLNQQKLAMDAHAIVSIADAAGDIVYANDRFCKISGYSADELLGQNHRLLRSQEQDDHFFAEMWETISRGEIWTGVIGNRNKAGGLYWVNTTIVPFLDHAGLPYQYVSVRTDITDVKQAKEALAEANVQLERRVSERTEELAQLNRHLQGQIAERDRLEAELRRLASRDSLTGLFNRRRFDEEFARELARCQRNHSPMAMILLDIDHFKAINDRHGHQAGDAVLHQLADILRKRARSTDVVARWGGEEFVFLAVGSGSKSAVTVAESLRHTVETTDFASVGHVTCSAGVANYMPGDTLHSLFARADRALYRAKENDRNRVEVEQPAAATE
jgi:diguanylate cyclase (GGDEF)-like protein/PAS domain S-box-containing protein